MAIKLKIDVTKNKEKMTTLESSIDKSIVAYNEALNADSIADIAKIEASLIEDEKEYRQCAQRVCFANCAAAEKPMLKAIETYSFLTLKHQVKNVNLGGVTTSVCARQEKEIPIDLFAFDTACNRQASANKNWVYTAQKFNFVNALRVAQALHIDPKEVSDSYDMDELAKAIDLGATPTSTTQMVKMLQRIVDEIVYEAKSEENPENKYRVTEIDCAYIAELYSRKGKKALAVATAKHSYMRQLIADVCHKIVTGVSYGIEVPKMKNIGKTSGQATTSKEQPKDNKPEQSKDAGKTKPEGKGKDKGKGKGKPVTDKAPATANA